MPCCGRSCTPRRPAPPALYGQSGARGSRPGPSQGGQAQQRHQLVSGRERSVPMPMSEGLPAARPWWRRSRTGPQEAATTSPDPRGKLIGHRAEPARRRWPGPWAAPRPGSADDLGPGRGGRRRGRGPARAYTWPGPAAPPPKQCHPPPAARAASPHRSGRPGPTSTMPWVGGHVQRGTAGQRPRELLGQLVHVGRGG